MVFSSLFFLFIFLPITLVSLHFSKSIRHKNIVILTASLIFYAWGEPKWIFVMLLVTLIDWLAGIFIHSAKSAAAAKSGAAAAAVITLGALFVFKYLNFFTSEIDALFHTSVKTDIALPIGISFYTFQALTYVIDVYKGNVKCQKNYFRLLLYVSMFPQLIAGPIVRYSEIEKELTARRVTYKNISDGITRFVTGLFKKVFFADLLGSAASLCLDGGLKTVTFVEGWVGIISFFFQIYFDFSGYSDMAIGLGKMMGFTFPENFRHPYASKSVTEFWRRWHITLSSFFRDYVYIPLGGNRRHHTLNLLIVWALTGFWHGASWNYILWGLYYFVLLVLEKNVYGEKLAKLHPIVQRIYLIFAVVIGWVFFYNEKLPDVGRTFAALIGANGFAAGGDGAFILNRIILYAAAALAVTPLVSSAAKRFIGNLSKTESGKVTAQIITVAYQVITLFISVSCLVGSTYNPFLYFRF